MAKKQTIVNNKTARCIMCGGIVLIPGTNCVEIDAEAADAKYLVAQDCIEVTDPSSMDEAAQKAAVEKTNTQEQLDKVEKIFKKVDTSRRRKQLDDYDTEVKKANAS